MKKTGLIFLSVLVFSACSNNKNIPDVSGIKVEVPVERFDQHFFAIDTNDIAKSLSVLGAQYPSLMPVFMGNILGLHKANTDSSLIRFLRLNRFIADSVNKMFGNTNNLKKEIEQAFRYVKYYFPDYKVPKVITIIGPVDVLAETASGDRTPNFLGPDFLGVSLQFYLGKDFSLYKDGYFITNVAPQYRSRRFDKKYIVPDAMKLITDDLFPDRSRGKGLIEQMIEKGKQWWLLDKFLPQSPDSVKTGYTGTQLEFCKRNEGLIWQTIINDQKDLYTIEPVAIQTYIGEAPFTQTMGENSPGNIGPWVGWQMVKKFAEKNSSMKVEEIMKADPKTIFDEARYKPK